MGSVVIGYCGVCNHSVRQYVFIRGMLQSRQSRDVKTGSGK